MKSAGSLSPSIFVISIVFSAAAEADLIGIPQSYPDVTLNNSYLIYDNDGVDNKTGLLKLVAFSSTLNEGPGSGNASITQSYVDGSDKTTDLMLSIAVDRLTGNWVNSSNSNANSLGINFGNNVVTHGNTNTPGFSWMGNITGFGWQPNDPDLAGSQYGTFFDASWQMTQDNYEDMPKSLDQFTDELLSGKQGGIKISNSAGFGSLSHPVAFASDWVFGTNAHLDAVQAMLEPHLTKLLPQNCSSDTDTNCVRYIHSTVTADSYISTPIPAAFWLWAGALSCLFPSMKRSNKPNNQAAM